MKNIIKSLSHPDVFWVVSLLICATTVMERLKNDSLPPLLVWLTIPASIYLFGTTLHYLTYRGRK